MIQPSVRPTVGRRAFREEFARPLLTLVPDLHGTVESWSATGDLVYIELRLEGRIGRRPFTLHTCDRIRLRDGKAVERIAYLDPAPLLKAVALSPRSWPRFIRAQLRSLRRPA
jgi:ketosteroid isomerase-like protein